MFATVYYVNYSSIIGPIFLEIMIAKVDFSHIVRLHIKRAVKTCSTISQKDTVADNRR